MRTSPSPEQAKIIQLTDICKSFPEIAGPQVPRDNVLQMLETVLDGDVQLVTVEGDEGIGKTTLLAQFATKHSDKCFSIFIRPTSRFAYDPTVLLSDLCDQMSWLVSGKELSTDASSEEAMLRHLTLELQRNANRTRRKFYFVVDGLEDIPKGGPNAEEILAMIPLGLPQFKVLVSNSLDRPLKWHVKTRHKSVLIPPFSLDETTRFFASLQTSAEQIHEFHKATKGLPANLAAIRRIIEAGISAEDLLEDLPKTLPNLFEFEWRVVDENNELQLNLLATIAHDRRPHNISELAAVFEADRRIVRTLLRIPSFIKLPESDEHEIVFVSETFRKFACSRLLGRREQIRSKLIDHLLKQPDTKEALTFLPMYLQEAGRFEDLLAFLSPEHFTSLMGSSQSLAPADQKAEMGLETALRLDRDGDILRFGLERTVIADVDDCAISKSEIEARMALGDYQSSVAVAQTSVLKHDRLRLLATIAKLQKDKGLTPEPELIDQIAHLYDEVDLHSLKDKIPELATDLMYSRPDLAIKLVKSASAPDKGGFDHDWELARLSMFASMAQGSATNSLSQAAEQIRVHIKDRTILGFSTALPLLIGNYSSTEVLREIAKLEDSKDQLFLLRVWADHTKQPERAGDIIEYALRLAVKTADYTPVATDLRQLARPLPLLGDTEQMRRLVGILDTQKATAEKLGPTEDYVRLQLRLTDAEARYDPESATRRLLETYYYIAEIRDLEVSTACTARLVSSIPKIDPYGKLSDSSEVLHTSTADFHSRLQQLLDSTADHYLATRNVVKALARNRIDLAIHVARSLNVEPRRDAATLDIFTWALDQEVSKIPLEQLRQLLEGISDPDTYDEGLLKVLDRLSSATSEALDPVMKAFSTFIVPIQKLNDASLQCRACCKALTVFSKATARSHDLQIAYVQTILKQARERIGDDRLKIETMYRISSFLAPYFREEAALYLDFADDLRKTGAASPTAPSYMLCVRLAIRAYSGLLTKHFDSEDDLSQLVSQIERVASDRWRVFLWTDLALKFVRFERPDDARRVVSARIKPALEKIRSRDTWQWQKAVADAAPALYEAHKATALELVNELNISERDSALNAVTTFILRKVWIKEPYESKGAISKFHINYEEAIDICELINLLDEDALIYAHIENIVNSILWKHNKSSFTQQQRNDIASRLSGIASRRLPNPRFIKHAGFKIIAEAQICRLTRPRPNPNEQIETTTERVPNPADRAYILSAIARSDSTLDLALRGACLRKAKVLADQIQCALDRASRYETIAESAAEIDPTLCKDCVREAFGILPRSDDSEVRSLKAEIVDFAHQIDPDWAATLAASLDNDPARTEVRERIAAEELKKKIADGKLRESSTDADTLADATWSLLGQLNANRIEPLPVSDTRAYVREASLLPLSQAYPIMSWVIENAIQRRSQAEESRRTLRGIYSAVLVGCELSFRIGFKASSQVSNLVACSRPLRPDVGIIVHTGERTKALDFLRTWLVENAVEYVKISDPYFGPSDLQALQIVLGAAPGLRVRILTSRRRQEQESECGSRPIDEEYRRRWKQLSDQTPPETDVVIIGNARGDLPIHDRWWLTRNKGLRLGSSFNSLGGPRESEIVPLTDAEVQNRELEVDQFLTLQKREHDGEKLSIYVFGL